MQVKIDLPETYVLPILTLSVYLILLFFVRRDLIRLLGLGKIMLGSFGHQEHMHLPNYTKLLPYS